MIWLSLSIIFVIFQTVVNPTNSSEVSCDRKTEVQMDNGLTKLLVVGQKNSKFPTNERQLRPFCNQAFRVFDMASQYSFKCLPKFGVDAAKVIMHSIGQELKAVCKSGKMSKRARELLGAATCANAGLDNWQRCNLKVIEKFTGTVNAPALKRIPMGCCNFHAFIKCMVDEAEEVKLCSRKTVDFVIKYVSKVAEPILTLLCYQWDESNTKCDEMVRITPNRTKIQKKYRSVLIPLINIAVSLEGEDIQL